VDRLEEMFKKNCELRVEIFMRKGARPLDSDWVLRNIVAMIEEIGELASELKYHWWRQNELPENNKMREELIDVLHFWFNIAEALGMTADDIYDVYMKKNAVNFDRIRTGRKTHVY